MESLLREIAYIVALLAESIAIVIIFLGIVKTLVYFIRRPEANRLKSEAITTMRTHLGGALSLSLEFLIGADVLKTAISPSWNEIGMLGAIVIIRTVLNYFLMQDLRVVQR